MTSCCYALRPCAKRRLPDRLLMIWLQTAWMPVTFVVPVVLGFACRSAVDHRDAGHRDRTRRLCAGGLVRDRLPALTLVPAALSSMGAISVGRYISANRRVTPCSWAPSLAVWAVRGGQYLRLDRPQP